MMRMSFDLEQYLTLEVEKLIKDVLKITLKDPKQSAFFLRFAAASREAARRRHEYEKTGEHIPSFLICSITENCNLHCAGCYAQVNHACAGTQELSVAEWERIFGEAEDIGVSVILLAGGEPLLRRDVMEAAAKRRKILFPVFTNGTLLDDSALNLFNANRNLVPVVSIEGNETATDSRRGQGVYTKTKETMRRLRERGLPFGASITVTTDNLDTVTDDTFIDDLELAGCKGVVFVEYVPVELPAIVLSDDDRTKLADRVNVLRSRGEGAVLISFPGDEAKSGGCLAAGRGFLHISASGDAEPCPFSPYSDLNLKNASLREALNSPLFLRLRDEGLLSARHTGGCVLFENEKTVARLTGAG